MSHFRLIAALCFFCGLALRADLPAPAQTNTTAEPLFALTVSALPGFERFGSSDYGSPSAATDGRNFLVVNQHQTTRTNGDFRIWEVVADRYQPDGTNAAATLEISDLRNPMGGSPGQGAKVASNGTNFLVVWWDAKIVDQVDFPGPVYGAIVTLDPFVASEPFIICDDPAGDNPQVASNGTDYYVAWLDRRDRSPANQLWEIASSVYGTKISADGTVKNRNGLALDRTGNPIYNLALASNGQNYLAVWSDSPAANQPSIRGALVGEDGIPLGSSFALSSGTAPQSDPLVTSDGTNYFVAWFEGLRQEIYGTSVSSAGSVANSRGFAILQDSVPDSSFFALGTLNGNPVVLWRQFQNQATSRKLYGRVGDMNGTFAAPAQLIADMAEQYPVFIPGTDRLLVLDHGSSTAIAGRLLTPGGLEFPSDTYNVAEGAGSMYIEVIRRGSLSSAATVQYSTHGETATAGLDYREWSGELHFAVNQGTNYFTVPIVNDQIPEPSETFTVSLTGDGLGARTTARVTIIDDDAPIQFAQSSFTVSPEVQQNVMLPVGRQATGGAAATVSYVTHAGSATPGVDYVETSGTLQFAAAEQFKTLPIPILNSHFPEASRTFTVTLSGSEVGASNTAQITILGGDLGFAFPQQNFVFVEGANSNATISVTRNGDLATPGAVAYRTEGDTATPGADYIETRGILQFAAGERTKTFDVPILDDALIEGYESFAVILSAADTNNLSGPQIRSTVTIADDDRGLEFSQSAYDFVEGFNREATLSVIRGGTPALNQSARVIYATSRGTATPGSDYVEMTGEIDFARGEAAKSFTIPLLDDNEVEQTETFRVQLFSPDAPLGWTFATTVRIQDNERGFEVQGDAYLTEGQTTNAILTVSRSVSNAPPATVHYSTQAGTAKPGQDYIETTGTLEFAAGENSKTISIPILDDSIMESSESFTVGITSDSPLGSRTSATVYINDDDRPFEFTQDAFYVSELNRNVMLTVARAGTSGGHARIIYATQAANAIPGTDYTETTEVLNFAPGEKSKSFTIPILDDNEVDGTKTFTVTLFAIEGTLGKKTNATVTIQDDERPVFLDLSSTNLARPDGPVRVLSRLPDGSIFMGGAFTNVDDHPTPGVARLHSDGSFDDRFVSSLSAGSSVQELAPTSEGGVILGGILMRAGEPRQRGLAQLKPDGTWDEGFNAGTGVTIDPQGNQRGSVSTIQFQSDGRILIGGNFNYIAGVSRGGFARLNADGTLDTSFQPNWGPPKKLRVQEDGRIVASYGYGGSLVRFLPGGQMDSSFPIGLDGSMFDFELQPDGRILIAGDFRKVGGVARPGLARLNADGSVDESFTATPSPVTSIMPYVWRVWLAEDGHVLANSSALGLLRTTSSGILDTQFSEVASDLQTVLSGTNGTVLIGGGFSQLWPFPAPFLARLRPDGNGKGVTFGDAQQLAVNEDSPFAEISLARWGTLAETFTVRVRTADGSATAGSDYMALNQEVSFAPGERQKNGPRSDLR